MRAAEAEKREEELMRQEIALEDKKLHLIRLYLRKLVYQLQVYFANKSGDSLEGSKAAAMGMISTISDSIDRSQLKELQEILKEVDLVIDELRASNTEKARALLHIREEDKKAISELAPLLEQQIGLLKEMKKLVSAPTQSEESINAINNAWNMLEAECLKEAEVIRRIKEYEESVVKARLKEFLIILETQLKVRA